MFVDTNRVGDQGDLKDQEAEESLECASSIVMTFKTNVSVSNLEIAIFLFRMAREQCPPSHYLRSQLLKDLSGALGVSFIHGGKLDDLQDSLSLRTELIQGLRDAGGIMPTPNNEDDNEISEMIKLAGATVSEFRQAMVLSDLETAIFLFENALAPSPSPNSTRKGSLVGLAEALFLRFCHSDDLHDITFAVSHLREAIELWPADDPNYLRLNYLLSCLLGERFNRTSQLSDLDECLSLGSMQKHEPDNSPPNVPIPLTLLTLLYACRLCDKYSQSGNLHQLNIAIKIFQEGIPKLHPGSFPSLGDDIPPLVLSYGAVALNRRFQHIGDRKDLDEAISVYQKLLSFLPPEHPLLCDTIHSLAVSLSSRYNQDAKQEDLDMCIMLSEQALELTPQSDPERHTVFNNLAIGLHTRYDLTGQRDDIEKAIEFHRQALSLLPSTHPERHALLNDLAIVLRSRYVLTCQRDDLEEAIEFLRQALALLPLPHPGRSCSLDNLARVLYIRFGDSGDIKDLEEVIRLSQQALELLAPSHPKRSNSLTFLAIALQSRFSRSTSSEDLEYMISLYREALDLRPLHHPEHPSSLNKLANALHVRYKSLGVHADLDEAILLLREAMRLQGSDHLLRMSFFGNLADALFSKFEQDGKMEDLDEAISLNRNVLELQHPEDPSRYITLSNLATVLSSKFRKDGKMEDLDEAILLHRTVVEQQLLESPSRDIALGNLAIPLITRFLEQGQRKDSEDAISYNREALSLRPPSHPDRCLSLNNLSNVLGIRFKEDGRRSDLDEAIMLLRQALELLHPSHPLRSSILTNLGGQLGMRIDHYECQRGDLEEAITLFREALKLQTPAHQCRSNSLNCLALALHKKFGEDNYPPDLEEAILLHREALELTPPPHPERAGFLNNLAHSLVRRAYLNQQPMDLYEASRLYQESLELRPPGHAQRFAALTNLGISLNTLSDREHDRKYLDQAISLLREALTLLSADHPQRSHTLGTLACTLVTLYDQQKDPLNDGLLDEAMGLFREATETGPSSPSWRFPIAKFWALQADRHGHSSAMDAYESATELLPQLAALSSDTQSRQKALTSGTAGLAENAAACAIRRDEFERAVEFLEAGRAVFWAQALQLRTSMDDLKEINPHLERRLRNIALSLEIASHQEGQARGIDNLTKMKAEAESTRLRSLNDEWNAALDEARRMNGFENFLKPRKFSDLRVAASNGPIVMVVPGESATHMLILTENDVKYLSRPELSLSQVRKLVDLVHVATGTSGSLGSSQLLTSLEHIITTLSHLSTIDVKPKNSKLNASERAGRLVKPAEYSITQDEILEIVLAVLWYQIVKPIVKILELQKSDDPDMLVRWCLTGPFTFLPVHAAGFHALECASDYLISSYIPTISSLLLDPSHSNSRPEPVEILAVIQSETLPATKREMEMIEKHVPPSCLTKLGVTGTPAGVEDVASHLRIASIVHFACHGIQDPFNPLESALILDDGQLQISRIMKQPLPNASLAFLCACETAVGDQNLPDEMISLATALLYSGFRNVVGTMWSIADEDGPSVADTFYEHLLRDENAWLYTKKTAKALHIAVKKLRDNNVPFLRWVPFIHLSRWLLYLVTTCGIGDVVLMNRSGS